MSSWPHTWPALVALLLALRSCLVVAYQTIESDLKMPQSLAIDRKAGRIYWAEVGAQSISSAFLNGSDVKQIMNSSQVGGEVATGVAVDSEAGKVYWTTQCCSVRRANLDGSEMEHLTNTTNGGGIALDTEAGKMYWTSWMNGTLWRADLNGTNAEVFLSHDDIKFPMDLALDTIRGYIYWTDVFVGKHTVNRASLVNGSGMLVLNVSSAIEQTNGITIDLARNRLYIAGSMNESANGTQPSSSGAIYRASLDSDENFLIVGGGDMEVPYGIVWDPDNGAVIWTDQKAGTIQRLDMRCAPGSLWVPSRTNASDAEVTYGPMNHGGLLSAPCPSSYTGAVKLVCYDGKVSVSSGTCAKQCSAGIYAELNGTNIAHGVLADGDTFTAGCEGGLVGPVMLLCSDGVVVLQSGKCQVPKDCPAGGKPLLEAALIEHGSMLHGTTQSFSCPQGFNGSYVLGCRNGAVYPVTGMCSASCETGSLWVDQVDGPLEVQHSKIQPGQTLNIFCPEGSAGQGIKLQCVNDYITILSAECTITKRCPEGSQTVDGAVLQYAAQIEGYDLSARCPSGFTGSVNFTCEDGQLARKGGRCYRDCPAGTIEDANNVSITHLGAHDDDVIVAVCPTGYGGILPLRCSDGTFSVQCSVAEQESCTCQAKAEIPAPKSKDSVEVPVNMLVPIIGAVVLTIAALLLVRYAVKFRRARSLTKGCVAMPSSSTLATSGLPLGLPARRPGLGGGFLPERDGDPIADEAGENTSVECNEDRGSSIVPLPSYWATSEGFAISPDPNRINEVQQLMSETWRVCYTRDRMMVGGGTRVPVGCRVANVLRIENHRGYEKFFQHKERVAERRRGCVEPFATTTDSKMNLLDGDGGEKYLFHGTTPEAAHNIARNLFRIDMAGSSRGCMFGPGIYLAENASKSDEYAKEGQGAYMGLAAMLICRAATGRVLRVESSGDFSGRVTSGEYDSVCGDRLAAAGTFREMVFFHEEALYPEFIVIYARVYDS